MKYKKGDKVVIRNDLESVKGHQYFSDHSWFTPGKEVTIYGVAKDHYKAGLSEVTSEHLLTDEIIDHNATNRLRHTAKKGDWVILKEVLGNLTAL